ncbi:hypothetical protein B0H13DRAFT_1865158 [Mycena leptocephala]|nr:hypothetical protein B0H13DRAFT_1865158 [Mycena leptocephala]
MATLLTFGGVGAIILGARDKLGAAARVEFHVRAVVCPTASAPQAFAIVRICRLSRHLVRITFHASNLRKETFGEWGKLSKEYCDKLYVGLPLARRCADKGCSMSTNLPA